MSYCYCNRDDNRLNIYKTLKNRKISKLDNDIIFKGHYRLIYVRCYVLHSDEPQGV
jgi:hypothetical protein